MNAADFVSENEYNEIQKRLNTGAAFYREYKYEERGKKHKLELHAAWRHKVENGIPLSEYNIYLRYEEDNRRGFGGHVMHFNNYEEFKDDINSRLRAYDSFDEIEQTTLF